MTVESELNRTERRLPEGVMRAVEIIGSALVGAATGYATAKGFELIIPVEEGAIFESASAIGGAMMAGFVAAELS